MYEETVNAMLLQWLQGQLVGCSVAEADTEATLREKAGAAIGERAKDMHTPLADAGMVSSRTPAKRYYRFSLGGGLVPVRVRREGEAR